MTARLPAVEAASATTAPSTTLISSSFHLDGCGGSELTEGAARRSRRPPTPNATDAAEWQDTTRWWCVAVPAAVSKA